MNPTEAFFAIPELLALLASSLDRQDLSRLMRTSRFIHSHCSPRFYGSVDVRGTTRLARSRDGMLALEQNAHLVRGIRMDSRFFEYYYECLALAAASEKQPLVGSESAEGVGAGTGVGAGAGRGEDAECMFLGMTNLSRFEYNPPAPGERWNHWDLLPHNKAESVLSKFCLMVPPAQSQHLVSLTLNGMLIKHPKQLGDLARTVSGMTRLCALRLGIQYQDELIDDLILRIFFNLPLSIQKFTVRVKKLGFRANWAEDTVLTSITENMSRRDGPLLKLKEWDVVFDNLQESPQPFFLMFPYCPELELVTMPQLMKVDDEERLVTFIVEHCPKICRLSHKDLVFPTIDDDSGADEALGNHDGVLLKITSQGMPENTLQSFYYDGYYEGQSIHESRLPWILDMQFASLTEIHLRNTRSLCRYSASQLLHLTPVLESLVIIGCTDEWEMPYGLKLQSLNDVSWATDRLRELRLAVDLGYLPISSQDYGNRPSSLSRIHVDIEAMSFGSFLANVGKQKDLRMLDLRVVVPNRARHANYRCWTYHDEIFPGLLTLGGGTVSGCGHDSFRRRRGFLDMLAGLSKLEELRGSVNLNPRDPYGYTTGREEAEWMKEHWPNLKFAEFYPQLEGYQTPPISDPFLWLKEQLPGLTYTDDCSA
ncbi:hypothetical protein BGW39_002289 [Mortierella sp. 14UC]|nr:hypothetical protein BGW39_002289 [Mortierella sp. 14UC]